MMGHPTATLDDVAARIPDAPPGITPSREEIAAVASLVGETFKPQQIVLFGSRAYGVPKPDSDVDLMVVMETPDQPGGEERRIRRAIGYGRQGHWQIIVRSPAEIRRGLAERDFFIRDVMTKGITLYEGSAMASEDDATPGAEDGATPGLKHATLDWIGKAEDCYQAALRLRHDSRPFLNHTGFYTHRSVEEFLKALLQEHELEFPRTQDLVVLAGLCDSLLPDLFALEPTLEKMTDWADGALYPGMDLKEAQVDEAVRTMIDVRASIRSALGLPTI